MRIGLLGALISNENLGCVALTYSVLDLLERISNEMQVEFDYYVFEVAENSEEAKDAAKNLNIREEKIHSIDVTPLYRARRFVHHFAKGMKALTLMKKCDLFIDLTAGDSFTDIYGQYVFESETNIKLYLEKIGKPFILGPQTYGPFLNEKNKMKAKKAIENACLVISRDDKSKEFLREFTNKEIYTTTDLAFGLPYNKNSYVKSEKLKVGFNVSGLLLADKTEKTNLSLKLKVDYDKFVTELVQWFIEQNYDVYFIPHVGDDGREFLENRFGNKIHYYDKFSNPIEAKNAIAKMDVFLGSRMHATIGAFSAGVPVVPIAYSRKFSGLFEKLQYPYVVDLLELSTKEALNKTEEYVHNYEELKENMNSGFEVISYGIEENKKLISNVIKNII